MKASFVSYLLKKYPNFNFNQLDNLISENLISPYQVKIKTEQLIDLKNQIQHYWNLRSWSQKNLNSKYESLGLSKPKNYSACMSYDFHLNQNGKPELIEINTNASFLALGIELYQMLELKSFQEFSQTQLIEMFRQESKLCGQDLTTIAILDQEPESQKLYFEFLLYKEIFLKHDIKCDIVDLSSFKNLAQYSLIYNRYTDFYLKQTESQQLRNHFNEHQLHLTPNPYEYFLLADKERLIDWFSQTEIERPSSLLGVYDMAITPKEKIWSERKNMFFKPKNSFGSKQSYKGASVSKKVFDEACEAGFIAQTYSQAPEVEFTNSSGVKEKFKYDLRCYAYRDQLQIIMARLYQGQTTNLKSTNGGFACVVF